MFESTWRNSSFRSAIQTPKTIRISRISFLSRQNTIENTHTFENSTEVTQNSAILSNHTVK